MPLPAERDFRIFDPRRGEDYILETSARKKLSLLKKEFLVVSFYPGRLLKKMDFPPSLSLDKLDNLVRASMERVGKLGFFTISPVTTEVKLSHIANLPEVNALLGSAIGYFKIDGPSIVRHFDLRRRLASYAEWAIGSCEEYFVRPKEPRWFQHAVYWDTSLLAMQIENVGCLSTFYGETGEHIFLTRIYTGIDDWLEPLRPYTAPL